MNGKKILFDSNIIIYASKSEIDLTQIINQYDEFYVSIINYMEVYSCDFKNEVEKALIDELFSYIDIVDINLEIANSAIVFRKNKLKKLKLPDAIVLATAKYIGADLLTNDFTDFGSKFNSVKIINT